MTSSNPPKGSIYTLKSPCANCPFRSDKPFHLDSDRVKEIADSLRDLPEAPGGTFYCHTTVDYGSRVGEQVQDAEDDAEADAFDGRITSRSRACAGALATLEKEQRPNQIMRIAERLGLYDMKRLDHENAPVYESLDAWEAAMCGRDAETKGTA